MNGYLTSDYLTKKYDHLVYSRTYFTTPAGRFASKFAAYDSVDGDMNQITFEVDPRWKDVDFSIKPDTDYFELCRQRAKHIRQNYEYVRVFLSGGHDSATVLKSFIDSKSHIDEIVVIHRYLYDPSEISNYEEYVIAGSLLELYKDHLQNTKITHLHGDRHSIDHAFSNPDWAVTGFGFSIVEFRAGYWTTNPFCSFPELLDPFDQDIKIADVTGLEKSSVMKINGEWYNTMLDAKMGQAAGRPGLVPFFVDPAFPELFVLDAHLTAETFEHGGDQLAVLKKTRLPHPCHNLISHQYMNKYYKFKTSTMCEKSISMEVEASLHKQTEHLIPKFYDLVEKVVPRYSNLLVTKPIYTGRLNGHLGLCSSLTRPFNCNYHEIGEK